MPVHSPPGTDRRLNFALNLGRTCLRRRWLFAEVTRTNAPLRLVSWPQLNAKRETAAAEVAFGTRCDDADCSVQYRFNGGEWTDAVSSTLLVAPAAGAQTVEFRGVDSAGDELGDRISFGWVYRAERTVTLSETSTNLDVPIEAGQTVTLETECEPAPCEKKCVFNGKEVPCGKGAPISASSDLGCTTSPYRRGLAKVTPGERL